MTKQSHYVYIILCSNDSLYTGYTNDLMRRYEEHVAGSIKCKYTRSFPPKKMLMAWEIDDDKTMALRLEAKIKRLNKNGKLKLIAAPDSIIDLININDRQKQKNEKKDGVVIRAVL